MSRFDKTPETNTSGRTTAKVVGVILSLAVAGAGFVVGRETSDSQNTPEQLTITEQANHIAEQCGVLALDSMLDGEGAKKIVITDLNQNRINELTRMNAEIADRQRECYDAEVAKVMENVELVAPEVNINVTIEQAN